MNENKFPEFEQEYGRQSLDGGPWSIIRAAETAAGGMEISKAGFDSSAWLPAAVPGTALVSYINLGLVPDPNYDANQFLIRDEDFTTDFWYRTEIEIPEDRKYYKLILDFRQINWKADIWFNGHLLKNENPDRLHSIEGAFIRGAFDVSDYAVFGDSNAIAVLIYKNETPGLVTTQGLAEGPGPNGGLLGADNPTIHASVGWDWLPTIRGRDIGILGPVTLYSKGTVTLRDPWFETDLAINETSTVIAAENFITGGELNKILDNEGDNIVFDLGCERTIGSVTILWGSEEGEAAADLASRHPALFRIETSSDGNIWNNIDAHPGGSVLTQWFGERICDAVSGTEAFEGHAISDSIQGGTAKPLIDMGAWGPGHPVEFPVFSPQSARYVRFTCAKRRELAGKTVPAIIREIRVYAESPTEVEQSLKREFELSDDMSFIKFRCELHNSDEIARNVEVSGIIYPNNVRFKFYKWLEAGETMFIERAGIPIKRPHLWWPNGYGEQFLYDCKITVKVRDQISDVVTRKFGIRKLTYTEDGGILTLYCNGRRIICKGGNWGMDDGLLLDNAESYDNKVRLHAEGNMTMIRNWIGMTNNDEFYDACDKYGILVWDDFWLANPVDGPDPNDPAMFIENAADKIKRVRSHPSLALYCGRNEGNPPPEIDNALRRLTEELDGTRYYFPNSAMTPVGSGGGYSLAYPGGNRGGKTYFNDVTSPVLRSERGIPNVPALGSVRKFVAPENLWPISEVWALHDWTYHMNGPANSYMRALQMYLSENIEGGDFEIPVDNVQGQNPSESDPVFAEYKAKIKKMCIEAGEAWTVEEFFKAAQMINYEHHHALFDALASRRSNGLLMWMSQSAWPSFMWQTYDWYLDCNGGYYGARAGNQPIKAIWDSRDDAILVSNATGTAYENTSIIINIRNMYGKPVSGTKIELGTLIPDSYGIRAGSLDFTQSDTDIVFILLELYNGDTLLGRNFYWHNRNEYQDYRALRSLPAAAIEISHDISAHTIIIENKSAVPAIQYSFRLKTADGTDILPCFWSDNYITIMPGESAVLKYDYNEEKYPGDPAVIVDGYNA